MFIVWGTGLYGKVDEVPQLCHVATRFGHLYYVPLIPLGTYAVFSRDGDEFRGAPLPLSFKSLLVAWLRAALVVGAVVGAIASLIQFAERRTGLGVAGLVLSGAGLGLFFATYYLSWFKRASYERAQQIAAYCGLNPLAMLMIEVAYGRLTAAQADAELQRQQAAEAAQQGETPQV